MSMASWPKATPRPSQPSQIINVKEQQLWECGPKLISIRVGRMSLDDPLRSQYSDGVSVSIICSVDSASEGNR